MTSDKGIIDSIAASGRIWAGFEVREVRGLFFESLEHAKSSIQISAYVLGEENEDMKKFFKILEEKLEADKSIQFIINNISGDSVGHYSKKMLNKLKRYPNFHLHNFRPEEKGDLLHAKIVVIDRKFALVGSANISKKAMFSNYEIMLKISGKTVAVLANLLDRLGNAIATGEKL